MNRTKTGWSDIFLVFNLVRKDVKASRRISTQQGIPCRMESSDREDCAEILTVHEGMLELTAFMEHLHPPRLHHAPHHEAVFQFGVPRSW